MLPHSACIHLEAIVFKTDIGAGKSEKTECFGKIECGSPKG
jgi:hypothetical protein